MAGSTKEPTLYEILGVDPDADERTIKKAVTKASRKYHPDVAPGLDAMFLMVQHAGQVLTDSSKRSAYDASIGNRRTPPADSSPRGGSAPSEDSGRSGTGHQAPPRADSPPPRSEDSSTSGYQVPDDQYSGVLPREGHDVMSMPWILSRDEQPPVKITNAEMPWWGVLLLLLAGGAALLVGWAGFPLMFIPILLLIGFLLLRQFGRGYSARAWGIIVAAMVGFAVLPLLWGRLTSDPDAVREFTFGMIAVLGGCIVIATHTRYLQRRRWLRSKHARDGFSWGKPGEGLNDAVGKFDIGDVRDGIEGEELTAAEIGHFLGAIPGLRLVNGLAFPGSTSADVDHAVVCGDKIAFIDSKAWAPAAYTMSSDWIAIREERSPGVWTWRESYMHNAVDAYAKALRAFGIRGAKVRGYIVVHPKRIDQPLTLNSQAASEYNRMVTSRELIAELGAWFTEDTEQAVTVDRRTLSFLVGSMRG